MWRIPWTLGILIGVPAMCYASIVFPWLIVGAYCVVNVACGLWLLSIAWIK